MKDKNYFSTRNKAQKTKEKLINVYKINKPNLNDVLSDFKINKKAIISISTTYPHKNISSTLSNTKPFLSYKETLNKAYTKLNKVLHSYNMTNEQLYRKIANEIIFDENKKIVSIFKDYLLWYETSDFFQCYYKINKSIKMLKKFFEYYEVYTHFYPEYAPHEELLKIIKKNIKRKKKYMERLDDEEENNIINDNKEIFDRLIKDSEIKINESASKNSRNILQKNNSKNSKSTLNFDSMENNKNKNNGNNNSKDLYSVLKTFIDYEDKTFDSKEVNNTNILKTNDNLDNIFTYNQKLNKYIKNLNDEKLKEINKDKNFTINNNYKKLKQISPNINIYNDIINQKKKLKIKEEQIRKIIEVGRNCKNISLRKKFINSLLKKYNQTSRINTYYKYNESISNSKATKFYNIKYDKIHLIKINPQNIKKLFNSYNKYENYVKRNYYTISSLRHIEKNKSRQSPKSVINSSPFYSKLKVNNLILNTLKFRKKIKNKNTLNLGKLKKINSIKNSNRTNNNSEIENNKDSHFSIKSNTIYIKLKYHKFSKNLGKGINLLKRNIMNKISSTHKSNDTSLPRKKKNKKKLINRYQLINSLNKDNNSSIANSSANQNILSISINPKRLYTNQKGVSSIISHSSFKENSSYTMKDRIRKNKNNLILFNSNIKQLGINFLATSFNKKNKEKTSKNSFVIKKNKNKNKLKNSSKGSKLSNNSKNIIIKNNIDKSMSRNELNVKIKTNNNSTLKSCFSNTNHNLDKKNFFIFDDSDKLDNNKKNSIYKYSILNLNENTLIKNKIKKKVNINTYKETRICLKLPMMNNINKI